MAKPRKCSTPDRPPTGSGVAVDHAPGVPAGGVTGTGFFGVRSDADEDLLSRAQDGDELCLWTWTQAVQFGSVNPVWLTVQLSPS